MTKKQTKAERVKQIRARTGLSQTAFGEVYSIPMRTIQNWENGVTEAPDYVVQLLTRVVWEDFPEER